MGTAAALDATPNKEYEPRYCLETAEKLAIPLPQRNSGLRLAKPAAKAPIALNSQFTHKKPGRTLILTSHSVIDKNLGAELSGVETSHKNFVPESTWAELSSTMNRCKESSWLGEILHVHDRRVHVNVQDLLKPHVGKKVQEFEQTACVYPPPSQQPFVLQYC
jgi:hypothetical protein